MENVSRWIDDRVGKFNPDLVKQLDEKETKAKVPAKDSDLKDWLTGFVHMSVRTNKHIEELSDQVAKSTQETNRVWVDIKTLFEAQQQLQTSFDAIKANFDSIDAHLEKANSHSQVMSEAMPKLLKLNNMTYKNINELNASGKGLAELLPSMNQRLESLSANTSVVSEEITKNQQVLNQFLSSYSKGSSQSVEAIGLLRDLASNSNVIQQEILNLTADSSQTLSTLNNTQKESSAELKDLMTILKSEANINQAGNLVQTLNDILNDFNQKMQKLSSKK